MRKERHQKTFNDKFRITHSKLDTNTFNTIQNIISIEEIKLLKSKLPLSFSNFEEIIRQNGLYEGLFYIKPSDSNRLLSLNLENVHQNLATLNKQSHDDNDWAYDNNQFQKIFVLANDGDRAFISFLYNDHFINYIIDSIDTTNIFFEGNIAKPII